MLRLFDQLVSACQQAFRYVPSERLRSLLIDDQLRFGRLLDWQIRRSCSFKDAIDLLAWHRLATNVSAPYDIRIPDFTASC